MGGKEKLSPKEGLSPPRETDSAYMPYTLLTAMYQGAFGHG